MRVCTRVLVYGNRRQTGDNKDLKDVKENAPCYPRAPARHNSALRLPLSTLSETSCVHRHAITPLSAQKIALTPLKT